MHQIGAADLAKGGTPGWVKAVDSLSILIVYN